MRRKRCGMISSRFLTISIQFFAIYICIFHKTEVQTVILRCWRGLNHNWFQSYEATYYSASFPPHYRRVLLSHLLVFNLWHNKVRTINLLLPDFGRNRSKTSPSKSLAFLLPPSPDFKTFRRSWQFGSTQHCRPELRHAVEGKMHSERFAKK